MAVAGVAHRPAASAPRNKPLPLMAKSSGAPVVVDIALAEIAHDAGILDEADRLRAVLAFGGPHLRDIFLELRRLALEAGRRDVGEIVRDHVHRAIGRELLRKTNEK